MEDIKVNYQGEEFYLINFPVGDWSDDGHGKCNYFLVSSKKPTKEVRAAHFEAPKVLGFEIGDICHEYEDRYLEENIVTKLKELNYDMDKLDQDDDRISLSPEDMADIWLYLLNHINPELNLKLFPSVPMINFYGFEDGKHLRTPGYGLFE
ncbi:hypothetical protein HZA97_06185 [Candidatus Woesearchaeota archaeon]|nr:hypothetical protein [Candidatus Woesearchaeota archaeon]